MALIVAQLIILGHTFSVHHHHDDHVSYGHSHEELATDDHAFDFDQLFSNIQHATGEQLTFTSSHQDDIPLSRELSQEFPLIVSEHSFIREYDVSFQKCTFPPDAFDLYQSLDRLPNCLRGPPSFIQA
jgi:hypothetical protein